MLLNIFNLFLFYFFFSKMYTRSEFQICYKIAKY